MFGVKRVAKLFDRHKINANLTLGVQRGYGTKDHDKGVWTAVLWFPGYKAQKWRSTKVKYDGGSREAFEKARDIALGFYADNKRPAEDGLDDGTPSYAWKVANDYLEEIIAQTLANKDFKEKYPKLDPPYQVKGGRGFWDPKKLQQATGMVNNYVLPFFRTLRTNQPGKMGDPALAQITPQQLDRFSDFMREKDSTLAPSTILKGITQIRHIYRYAYRKGLVDRIPNLERPKRNMDARVRKRITEDIYLRMVDYTRKRYIEGGIGRLTYLKNGVEELQTYDVDTYKDYSYLFHLWILVLANTGIRPPTGGTEHTLIKWEHYIETDEGAVLKRPDEKNHNYTAIVMPRAIRYFDALKRFQEDRGIVSDYVFAHPIDGNKSSRNWEAGEPIGSFRGQWQTMLKELNLNAEKGAPQSERLVPSALRSFFITHRLKDGNVNMERLALSTGTSIEEIMRHYYEFSTQAEYQKLIKGGFQEIEKTKPVYDENGYYIGSE